MYMYVYMYTYTYTYIYICVCVCVCIYNHTYLYDLCAQYIKLYFSIKSSIYNGKRVTHQVYNILKNLQCKNVSKLPSKMLKKVDEGNEGTNQMSMSESENV